MAGEMGAVPRDHRWVTRSMGSWEKSFFLLGLGAKVLLGGEGGGERWGRRAWWRAGGGGNVVGGFSPLFREPRCYNGGCFSGGLHGWSPPLPFRDKRQISPLEMFFQHPLSAT